MYCSSCGTEVTKELNYCNRCGANLNPTTSVPEQATHVVSLNGTIWAMALMVVIGLGFIFSGVNNLANKGLHPAALTWIALGGLAMLFGVASLFLRHLSHLSGTAQRVMKSEPRKKAALKETGSPQLPPSRIELVPSVTEHTTRTFEPVYREPHERG
jgi:hypothetical protein